MDGNNKIKEKKLEFKLMAVMEKSEGSAINRKFSQLYSAFQFAQDNRQGVKYFIMSSDSWDGFFLKGKKNDRGYVVWGSILIIKPIDVQVEVPHT